MNQEAFESQHTSGVPHERLTSDSDGKHVQMGMIEHYTLSLRYLSKLALAIVRDLAGDLKGFETKKGTI